MLTTGISSGTPTTVSTTTRDATAPPTPTFRETPENPTTSATAQFKYTDAEPGVHFECRLDDGSFEPCGSAKNYQKLALGPHNFCVRALDKARNASAPTCFAWTIEVGSGLTITIGEATYEAPYDPLYHPRALWPTARNDKNASIAVVPVTVTNNAGGFRLLQQLELEVTIGWRAALAGHPDCSAADFSVDARPPATTAIVAYDEPLPAGASITHSFTVQMLETGRDQDACAGTEPSLTARAGAR